MKSNLTDKQLNRNVQLQIVLRVFQKRVFLPLAAIYFSTVAGFSLADIGLLATWFALVQVVVEVPTGMFADKYGKVLSERIGAFLNIGATLLYVFAPTHTGIFAGMALEAIGYSFFGGACEALLHDTLQAQGRVSSYTKILARIQSTSLAINAVLISLIPLTYQIDPTYPFLLGTLAYAILFVSTFYLSEVYPSQQGANRAKPTIKQRLYILRKYKSLVPFLLAFGIISGLYTAPSDFANIAFKNLGLAPEKLGFVFAAGSIAGVMFGWVLHWFKRVPFYVYALFDWAILWLWLVVVWFANLELMIVGMVVSMAFWRYRRIIYQEKLLEILQTNRKATALSVMNNAGQLNELYIPILFGLSASRFGIAQTYGFAALALLGVLVLWGYALRRLPGDSVSTKYATPEV